MQWRKPRGQGGLRVSNNISYRIMTSMTKFFSVKWLLTVFLPVVALSSCGFSDDDEVEPPTYPIELLGSWQGVDAEISTDGDKGDAGLDYTESLENIRVIINPNGTFVTYEENITGEWREKNRSFWKYKDKILYVFDNKANIVEYEVVKLDYYNLTIKSSASVADGGGDADDEGMIEGGDTPVVPDAVTVTAVVAVMLIVYGVIFILLEHHNKKREFRIRNFNQLSYGTAFAIGVFQCLALIPGTSRSGATIVGALLIGVSRTVAAEFTFFLAIPVMLGASLLKLLKFGFSFTGEELVWLGEATAAV